MSHPKQGEKDSIDIMLKRVLDAKAKREQPAETERQGPDLEEHGYSDEDLFDILVGVPDPEIVGGRLNRHSVAKAQIPAPPKLPKRA